MFEHKLILKSKSDTIRLGKTISSFLFSGSVVTLDGDLGAGKTTFAKGVAAGLKIKEEINSPTFNILKCYFNDNGLNLYHIDAYRLENINEENKNIGLDEAIEGDGVCVIEWPKFIKEFISFDKSLNIIMKIIDNTTRDVLISSSNEKYSNLIKDLQKF